MRQAGRDALSLALIDARNHTLRLLAAHEAASRAPEQGRHPRGRRRSALVAGRARRLVCRSLDRTQHPDCLGARLPRPTGASGLDRTPRRFLVGTFASRPATRARTRRAGLHRHARLAAGDAGDHAGTAGQSAPTPTTRCISTASRCSTKTRWASAGGAGADAGRAAGARGALDCGFARTALVPATRWPLGSVPGGFVFDNEKWAHDVAVPEFEIDAQPVSWAQFVEFVDDGGYDRPSSGTPMAGRGCRMRRPAAGGAHRAMSTRSVWPAAPAVMQTRFGPAGAAGRPQPAMHVSWWEADAWCRWAGRRLPAEVEWELAAQTAARRGFRWGDVGSGPAARRGRTRVLCRPVVRLLRTLLRQATRCCVARRSPPASA